MGFIESCLEEMCTFGLDSSFVSSLTSTLAVYNAGTNNTIVSIMRNSVFAVGASLLTLFMLMELVVMINRSDGGSGISGIKLPANILIKFAIFAFLFCHIPAILSGIEDVVVHSISSRMAGASYTSGLGVSSSDIATMSEAIEDLSYVQRIFTYITVLLCWLIVKAVKAIVSLTVVFRMFELWLMLMFSPIPLATIASQEFRQTALNFLKAFTAVCLRGAAIIGCFLIYNTLTASLMRGFDPSLAINEYISTVLVNNILYSIALAMTVFSSGKIVNRILNVI